MSVPNIYFREVKRNVLNSNKFKYNRIILKI